MQDYEKQIESCISKAPLESQRSTLEKWIERKIKRRGRKPKPRTILNSLYQIVPLGRFLKKDYEDMTREEIDAYYDHLRAEGKKESSVATSALWINAFMRWCGKEDCIIRIALPEDQPIGDPNRQVTEVEVHEMIKVCRGRTMRRDKAIVSLLFDAGLRGGELEALTIGSVESIRRTDAKHRVLVPKGKTGRRRVSIHSSVPYLREYIEEERSWDDLDAPLFLNYWRGTRLTYLGIYRVIKRVAKEAGIEKNVHPHLFRHGWGRDLTRKGLNPRILMKEGGWKNLRTPLLYSEIDGDGAYDAVAEARGVRKKKQKKVKSVLLPKICPFCDTDLTPTTKVCPTCHMILDPKAREKYGDQTERMFKVLAQKFSEHAKTIRELREEVAELKQRK